MGDLFEGLDAGTPERERIADGAIILRGFARDVDRALLGEVDAIAARAPFRHMDTRYGKRLGVGLTNCGALGWVSDRSGYRYDAIDPASGRPWPPMPAIFADVAARASTCAGYAPLKAQACLVNRYVPGMKLSLHQDRDELDFSAPIVSVSLGIPATFLFGGSTRAERPQRFRLTHGDVVVWGGPARLAFHGVATVAVDEHPLTGPVRINLTFRTVR